MTAQPTSSAPSVGSALPVDYAAEARSIHAELIALRRELHRIPEIGNDLPRTQHRVLEALEGLGLEISRGTSVSSIVAVLRGGRPGPAVLLRGDMDGLPVAEETGLDFASDNGAMHACGHDLHTAGLVGATRLLAAHREELPGSVVFMFQPGEEGPGGAEPMIREGLLEAAGERPVAAYGIHVAPGDPGVFTIKRGPALAGSNQLHVTMHGLGGHGSRPYAAADPVPALLELCTSLQVMISREFNVFDPVVATVTQLEAGEAINVIPSSARMGATVRTLSVESTERFGQLATRLADGIAAAHGVRAEISWEVHYPVTINDDAESGFVIDQLCGIHGESRVLEPEVPLMGSEDFSFVLREVPGCFFFLQCSPPDVDPRTAEWNHSPKVLFDDAVLADQAAALAHLAHARLLREQG